MRWLRIYYPLPYNTAEKFEVMELAHQRNEAIQAPRAATRTTRAHLGSLRRCLCRFSQYQQEIDATNRELAEMLASL